MHLIVRFIVNAIVLYIIANYLPWSGAGLDVAGAIIAAIVFGIINMLLGPVLRLITAPINWLTHGAFAIVVDYILFWIFALADHHFRPVNFPHWLAYLFDAIIMMVVATLLQQLWKPASERGSASTPATT